MAKKLLIHIYEFLRKRLLFLRRRLIAPALPKNSDGSVYLNLGCALNSGREFINMDVEPFPNIHYIQDITDLPNFPDRSVDMVYASHVVEHIPREKLRSTLVEWKRVLKPGGIFRFAVPDFDALIEIYERGDRDVTLIRDQLMGQRPPYNNHYTLWNYRQAETILTELGYQNIRRWDPATAPHHDFTDKASRSIVAGGRDIPFSLNVEATKP